MTHLDDLHALLAERAHLRAQRDELQRDCTRLEAEARAAREEVRKLRAATFDPKKSLERIFVENRTLLAELAKAEQDEREAELAINPPRPEVLEWKRRIAGRNGAGGWQICPASKDWIAVIDEPGVDHGGAGVYLGSLWRGSTPIEQDTFSSITVAAAHIGGWLRDRGWLDDIAIDMAAFAAKPAPEQPAAIPSQPKCEDIDEPNTIAGLLALGRPVIGLRVAVPFSVPPMPATVTSIDTHRDGDRCSILRDDGLSVSYWPKDLYFVKPASEAKPAYVARWRRCQTLVAWQLIDIAAPLVLSTMREDAEHGQFVATAGMSSFRESFLKECAMLAEDHLRAIGIIPAGPIDRSALNGLRRNVDPGTHNAARMATRPHRGTALRRRGNAARDGTRRRRLLGQWRWRQSDRHWRHPRAMRRRRRAMGHRERRSARWPHRPERVRMTDAPWILAASYHDDPAIVATAWRIAALQRELLELSYVLATLLIKAKSKRDLA